MSRFFVATPATFAMILSIGLFGALLSSVSMDLGTPGSFPVVLDLTMVSGLVLFTYALIALSQATYRRVSQLPPSSALNATQLKDLALLRWWPFVSVVIFFGGSWLTFYTKANPFWTFSILLGFVGMSAWLVGHAVCLKRFEALTE